MTSPPFFSLTGGCHVVSKISSTSAGLSLSTLRVGCWLCPHGLYTFPAVNFCCLAWRDLLSLKGNFRMIGDDLVNSYHLLLCCLDLIFANALLCPNRRDLLNPSFKGMVGTDYLQSTVLCSLNSFEMKLKVGCLPHSSLFAGLPVEFHTLEIKGSKDPPCIIAMLCELHDGLLVEAKGIKEHYFKPYIAKLFDRKVHLKSFISTWWCSVVVSRAFKSCIFHRGEQRKWAKELRRAQVFFVF